MSYILIILAVLVLLNTYPLLVSQSLVFRTKETAMKSSVKMVESALSGLPELTEENVGQALASVEETGVSRLLVTDPVRHPGGRQRQGHVRHVYRDRPGPGRQRRLLLPV